MQVGEHRDPVGNQLSPALHLEFVVTSCSKTPSYFAYNKTLVKTIETGSWLASQE